MRLDNRFIIGANHFKILPFPPAIITLINEWSSKNKLHPAREATFTFHDQDITNAPPEEDIEDRVPELIYVPPTTAYDRSALSPERQDIRTGDAMVNPYDAFEPTQYEEPNRVGPFTSKEGPFTSPPDEMMPYTEPDSTDDLQEDLLPKEIHVPTPDQDQDEENGVPDDTRPLAHTPPRREPSTRIRKPVDRLNLVAASPTQGPSVHYASMSVPRALKLFPEKTNLAI